MVNDPEVHKTTQPHDEFEAFSRDQLSQWLSGIQARENRVDFAIVKGERESEVFIGEVVLNEIKDGLANIRIALLPRHFNQGYGTEAMDLAIQYGFGELNLKKIELGVFDINPRGMRVYEKLGFKETSRSVQNGIYEIQMEILCTDIG